MSSIDLTANITQLPESTFDDYDPEANMELAHAAGSERYAWITDNLDYRVGNYLVYPVSVYKGYGSDSTDAANYAYFKSNYPFLHDLKNNVGFDTDAISTETTDLTDKQKLIAYLENIDEDLWNRFREDVGAVKDGICMDDDLATQIMAAKEQTWWKDNLEDCINKFREKPYIKANLLYTYALDNLNASDFKSLAVNADVTGDEVDGNWWLNLEDLAKKVDPQDLVDKLDVQNPAVQKGLDKLVDYSFRRPGNPMAVFEFRLKKAVEGRKDLQDKLLLMNKREFEKFFLDTITKANDPKNSTHVPVIVIRKIKTLTSDREISVKFAGTDTYDYVNDYTGSKQYSIKMAEFAQDYGVKALEKWKRIPATHPQLDIWGDADFEKAPKFDDVGESLGGLPEALEDKDTATAPFSAGTSGTPVRESVRGFKTPDKLVDKLLESAFDDWDPETNQQETLGEIMVSSPRCTIYRPTEDALKDYIDSNLLPTYMGSGRRIDVSYCKEVFMVVPTADEPNFLVIVNPDGKVNIPPVGQVTTKNTLEGRLYGRAIKKLLHKVARSYMSEYIDYDSDDAKGEDEVFAARLLYNVFGVKALMRYKDVCGFPGFLELRAGLDSAAKGKLKLATQFLSRVFKPRGEIRAEGYYLKYSDRFLQELYGKDYADSADEVLCGDCYERAENMISFDSIEIKDVIEGIPEKAFPEIRKLLVNRKICPYGDGRTVALSTQILKEFDNDDVRDWLLSIDDYSETSFDPYDNLEGIRDALRSAAYDSWRSAVELALYVDYVKGALEAISAEIVVNPEAPKNVESRYIEIPWKILQDRLSGEENEEAIEHIDDLIFIYGERAEPDDTAESTSWSDASDDTRVNDIRQALESVSEIPFDYGSGQLTMPDVLGPDPHERISVTLYNAYRPDGYEIQMTRKDMEARKRAEPWEFDKALAHDKAMENQYRDVPTTESLRLSGIVSVLLEQEYSYACAMIDLPPAQADFIYQWGMVNIPDEMLHAKDEGDNPRETEQHVTAFYGMTVNEVPEALRVICKELKPFPVYLGKVSLFKNEGYDVVKIDVESPWLRQLHADIKAEVPNEETYPEYKPHCTVAYVKSGSCDKLDGMDVFVDNQSGVEPQFIASGLVFKGAGSDEAPRAEENLLFSCVTEAVEASPFDDMDFPIDASKLQSFLKRKQSKQKQQVL